MNSNKICELHQEPEIYFDEQNNNQKQFLCKLCIKQRYQIKGNEEEIQKKYEKFSKQLELQKQENLTILKSMMTLLESQKQKSLFIFNSFIITIKKEIQRINDFYINLQAHQIDFQVIDTTTIIQNQLGTLFQDTKNKLSDVIIKFSDAAKYDQLIQKLENFNLQISGKKIELASIHKVQEKHGDNFSQKQQYEILCSYSKKACFQQYFAFAFNSDNTIIIAGCEKLIKVFEFQQEKLSEVQEISEHTNFVYSLVFLKNSKYFISGGCDKQIIVWGLGISKWEKVQSLLEHNSYIYSLAINQTNDLLISGSHDKTIKFWNNQNKIWQCSQTLECEGQIWSLSLSDQANKLTAIVSEKQLFVIEKQSSNWIIAQKIIAEVFGFRLVFLNDYQFAYLPKFGQKLQIYDYFSEENLFKATQTINIMTNPNDIYCLFPAFYIKEKNILIFKSTQFLNVIRKNEDSQFNIQQSIKFGTEILFGAVSNDGQYMVTWERQCNQVQIRKLNAF